MKGEGTWSHLFVTTGQGDEAGAEDEISDASIAKRPMLPGLGMLYNTPTTLRYDEGAEVGYRCYAKTNATPLFPFGYGLSYTTFALSDLTVSGGETITASFTVTNTGQREGADAPQLYLTQAPNEKRMRLLGFERVELAPGESRQVTLTADPRLAFDGAANQWHMTDGTHEVALGKSNGDSVLTGSANLTGRLFGK